MFVVVVRYLLFIDVKLVLLLPCIVALRCCCLLRLCGAHCVLLVDVVRDICS